METLVSTIVDNFCHGKGLEAAPFKLSWYNEAVTNAKFKLSYSEDSLCYVIISQPSMFEKSFLPYVKDHWSEINSIQDPLDQAMKDLFRLLLKELSEVDEEAVSFHDFEMHASRRPKVLVQTAGHVSGAVRFYQEQDACEESLDRKNGGKLFPVCLHPNFGGWFALRGIILLPNCPVPSLKRKTPPKVLRNKSEISHLLNLYNHHWRDGRFRDCSSFDILERYSQQQQDYFARTPGASRIEYLSHMI